MTIKVNILPRESYNPSTVTIVGYLNTTIDTTAIAKFLPISHIFDKKTDERVKLKSGSRLSIPYFGIDGIFISVCYKDIKRGMRTGAMNNMVSLDIQHEEKNIHLKMSATTITSVGTKTLESGENVFKMTIDYVTTLQEMLFFLKNVKKEKMDRYIDWFIDHTYEEKRGLIREAEFLEKIEEMKMREEKRKVVTCFAKYINDFDYDQQPELIEKINEFLEIDKIFSPKDGLICRDVTIYNSVYHITPIKIRGKNFKMPLHRLAPFLASINFTVEYHNWTSEGVKVCIDIQEEKPETGTSHKEYMHRFVIHETGKIRQCSPTKKEEAYIHYVGMMKTLQLFFDSGDIEFEKYIYDRDRNDDRKLVKMIEKIVRN
jgi:hypothetical protein